MTSTANYSSSQGGDDEIVVNLPAGKVGLGFEKESCPPVVSGFKHSCQIKGEIRIGDQVTALILPNGHYLADLTSQELLTHLKDHRMSTNRRLVVRVSRDPEDVQIPEQAVAPPLKRPSNHNQVQEKPLDEVVPTAECRHALSLCFGCFREIPDVEYEDFRFTDRELSWDLNDLGKEMAPSGCDRAKVSLYMVFQVLLSIYYAAVYGIIYSGFHDYYPYPVVENNNTSINTFLTLLTDEENFTCDEDNITYYLNGTGPLRDETKGWTTNSGFYRIIGIYFAIAIVFFLGFIAHGLYTGKFNRLVLLVKFRYQSRRLKPKKLAAAYTIMCNARTFTGVLMGEYCNYWAPPEIEFDSASSIVAIVYVLAWSLIILWILIIIFSCGIAAFCCDQHKQFRWFRRLIIVAALAGLVSWFVGFDISIDFNPDNVLLFITNLVALADLLSSLSLDIWYDFFL